MYAPTLQELLDGIARTVEQSVIPALNDGHAIASANQVVTALRTAPEVLTMIEENALLENSELRSLLNRAKIKLDANSRFSKAIKTVSDDINVALLAEYQQDQHPRSAKSLGREGDDLSKCVITLIDIIHEVEIEGQLGNDLIELRRDIRTVLKRHADRRDPQVSNEKIIFAN